MKKTDKKNAAQEMNTKESVKEKKTKGKKTEEALEQDLSATIGKKRSFAMAEAHKRLRTNIMFSFADDSECHVIGVTSAMAHEGKSTTSVNLAYDLMKAGKKTLLIDADMRLSRIAKLLNIQRAPGLSNVLVGKSTLQSAIQQVESFDGMKMIACGDVPPNPTELLSSKRFRVVLEALKKVYEYIVIDLPPVTEVSDALIVSKLTDGMLVVVRQDFVDKRLLDDTVHQLSLSEARIIGFVLTCAQRKSKFGKYKYQKGIGKSGYYRSSYSYGKKGGYYGKGYYFSGRHRSNDPYWQEHAAYEASAYEQAAYEQAMREQAARDKAAHEKKTAEKIPYEQVPAKDE